MRIPTDREPTHPGEMLRAEFLEPMGISQRKLAEAIHVPYQRVNELVNQKTGGHAEHGVKTGEVFQCLRRLLAQPAIPLGFVLGSTIRNG